MTFNILKSNFWVELIGEKSDVLNQFPNQKSAFVGAGLTMLSPVLTSLGAGYYFIYTLNPNPVICILAAIILATLVLITDVGIVRTFPKPWIPGSKVGFWLRVVGLVGFRVVMTVVISYFIAMPLKLAIFHDSIDQYLYNQTRKELKIVENQRDSIITSINMRIQDEEEALRHKREELIQLRKTRNEQFAAKEAVISNLRDQQLESHATIQVAIDKLKKELTQAKSTLQGTINKGFWREKVIGLKEQITNKEVLLSDTGLVAQQIQKLEQEKSALENFWDKKEEALVQEVTINEQLLEKEKVAIAPQITEIRNEYAEKILGIKNHEATDMVARYDAFMAMSTKSSSVFILGWLLVGVLMIFDTAPMLIKTIIFFDAVGRSDTTEPHPYYDKLRKEERNSRSPTQASGYMIASP